MLHREGRELRWCGIDMQSRGRRRVAVVLTYTVFFAWIVGVSSNLAGHAYWTLLMMVFGWLLLNRLSVFRDNGLVKSFEEFPRKVGARGTVYVNGLDEWARYFYGAASFDEATEEQQSDLLRRYRVGTYVVPAKPRMGAGLDEREESERNDVSRWVLSRLTSLLMAPAGSVAVGRRPLSAFEAGTLLFHFGVLARTLPQARVLWIEEDPRTFGGDIHLQTEIQT